MKKQRLIYFKWMGVYWSCTAQIWQELLVRFPNPQDDLIAKCRELRCRPKGRIEAYSDNYGPGRA